MSESTLPERQTYPTYTCTHTDKTHIPYRNLL